MSFFVNANDLTPNWRIIHKYESNMCIGDDMKGAARPSQNYVRKTNKNFAIANRSRSSCAHNTLTAFISLNVTP